MQQSAGNAVAAQVVLQNLLVAEVSDVKIARDGVSRHCAARSAVSAVAEQPHRHACIVGDGIACYGEAGGRPQVVLGLQSWLVVSTTCDDVVRHYHICSRSISVTKWQGNAHMSQTQCGL